MQSFGAFVNTTLGVREEQKKISDNAEKKQGGKHDWLNAYAQPEEKEKLSPEEQQRKDLKESNTWKKLAADQTHMITEVEMSHLFDILDLNKDGSVDKEEILGAFRRVVVADEKDGVDGEAQEIVDRLERIIATTDIEPDQPIDCEDLRQAMRLGCEDHAKAMTLKLQGHDPASGHWIWRDKLVDYLTERNEMFENCKSLPVTLFFFILFFYLASSYLKAKEMNILNQSVSGALNLKLDKVANNFPDSARDIVHKQIRSPYLANYNQVLGGWRVSKIRPDTEPTGPLCSYPIQDFVSEKMSAKSDIFVPEVCAPDWGNQSSWMLWALNNEAALSLLETEDGKVGWPGFASKPKVEGVNIDAVTFNEKMSMYTVIHLTMNILPSGYVKVKSNIESIEAHPAWLTISEDIKDADKATMMFVGIIFVIMFLLVAMGETLEYLQLICSFGLIRGMQKYIDFWNLIDWINIWMVALIMINYFYCIHITSGLNELVSKATQLDPGIEYTLSGLEYALKDNYSKVKDYTAQLDKIVQLGDANVEAYFNLKIYIAVFSFASALRFFKAFRANPRLNCVTQTLVRSAPDLAHFMLVFLALLMAFVLIGHLLFGSRIADFSTPGKSVNTCFLFLLCYAFDPLAPEMYEHGGVLGTLWAWSFNIGMVLLLLNMVLAIVFDVYTEVKTGAGDAPSLYQQSLEVFEEIASKASKRKAMLASVQDQVMKVGEANFQKEGEKLKAIVSPLDGDWQRAAEEGRCATIYGTDLFWASGDVIKLEIDSKGTEAAFSNGAGGVVKFKLNTEDPDDPKLVFDGGDMWVKCPEQDIVKEETGKTKQKSLKQKGDYTENDLLNKLDVHHAHPGAIVSAESLSKTLECTLIQEKQLEQIIDSAIEASSENAANQEVSLADSIRLVCRIDANVRAAVRLTQEKPPEQMSKEEERDIKDAEERMRQIEMALGTINAQLDRVLTTKTSPPKPMKM